MPDNEFSINEDTFAKMLALKKQAGFGKREWDEWFSDVLKLNSTPPSLQDEIENAMKKLHYESFNDWVQNFALNLSDIWTESSARALDPTLNSNSENVNHSAIVIGKGPSLKKHRHLELIAESKYEGSIVCCDGVLRTALQAGVTPDKFPNFYVVTVDPYSHARNFYDDKIVDEYGHKIKGIFSTISNPSVVERARNAGIKIHWLHSLFDYGEGKKSFNHISSLMVRVKNHSNGLPAIQTGGNVGTASWFISWQILKNSTVTIIGINHGWEEDDSWETIITHGRKGEHKIYGKDISVEVDKNSATFQKLFKKIYNPEFRCYCILDPLFQFYSEALKEFISRSPAWLTTINSTEGGSIFGKRIKCMTLTEFLAQYHH